MGTHPIFESDFDCLTEKMNSFRRAPGLISQIRSLKTTPSKLVAHDTSLKASSIGLGMNLKRASNKLNVAESKGNYIKTLISSNRKETFLLNINKSMDFRASNLIAKNISMLSNSPRLEKMFASFDLDSLQISFVGLMGDFAIWAITDLTTGEIQYVVDDSM